MLRIYHDNSYAIVADDYHKTYKEVSKNEAVIISKSFLSKVTWYETLENRRNTLITSGYKKLA